MTRRRFDRLTTTLCVVVSLLFAQFALAGYVCPGSAGSPMMAPMAGGEPCEGLDRAQPALCHQHAAAAAQSFEMVKLPAPSLPALVQVLQVPVVVDMAHAFDVRATAAPEVHPAPDPLFLSTLRLRV